MLLTRRIGLIVLAALAIASVFLLAPARAKVAGAVDHSSDRSSIESEYTSSEASATTVFQQVYGADVAAKEADELTKEPIYLTHQELTPTQTAQRVIDH